MSNVRWSDPALKEVFVPPNSLISTISGSSDSTGQTVNVASSSSSSPNVGAVVGGVIGGVVLALLAALIFFFLRRRRQRQLHYLEKSLPPEPDGSEVFEKPARLRPKLAEMHNDRDPPAANEMKGCRSPIELSEARSGMESEGATVHELPAAAHI